MLRTFLFFALLLLGSTLFTPVASAQRAQLFGTITDGDTGEPLPFTTIRTGDLGTVADLDGRYSLGLAPGEWTVIIEFVGYTSFQQNIRLTADENYELNVTLDPTNAILQTATVTSGRYERPLSEVTVSLEVIKPQLLESTNQTSLDGVLDKVPGVSMIDGQANIRGGSGYSYGAGSRVLLLLDDIPILQSDAGRPNWNDLPVENLEQIEIVKGAASALYGSSALNGIINVRTGFARAEPETSIASFGTLYGKPRVKAAAWWDNAPYEVGTSVRHARQLGKLDLVVSVFGLRNEDFRQQNFERYGRFTTNLRYRLSDRLSLGLNANYNEGTSRSFFYWAGLDSLLYVPAEGTISNNNPTRYNLDPYLTYYDNGGNRHRLLTRFFSVNNRNDNNRSNFSDLQYAEYQFLRRWDQADLVMTAGVVGTGTSIQAELYGDTTYRSRNAAGYLQLDKGVGERLNLSAGVRYEYNALFSPEEVAGVAIPGGKVAESKPVFRLGANYRAAEFTYLRASWGQGYRYPTVAEKFIQTQLGAVPIRANPLLESETGWSTELGVKQGFRVAGFSGFVDASAFWSEYDNMIEFNVPRGVIAFQSLNVGGTRIRGLELSVAGQGKLGSFPTTLLAGYTYLDPQFKEFDPVPAAPGAPRTLAQRNAELSSADYNVLKYRFKHSAKFDMETQFNRLSVGAAAIYQSRVEAVDAIFEAFVVPGLREWRAEETGSIILSSRIGYRLTDAFKLSLIGNNLNNALYSLRPGQLEAPRSWTMRVDVKW